MRPDIKKRWCEALRSGEYTQGWRSLLVMSNGKKTYCCLGVLCDLYSKETGRAWEDNRFLGCMPYLPPEVSHWAGLPPLGYYDDDPQHRLARLNDTHQTVPQIAAVIEEKL